MSIDPTAIERPSGASSGPDMRAWILGELEHSGTGPHLHGALRRITGPEDLVRFLHHYTVFNGNFAGGVASLAGAFHVRQDLFRDPVEPIDHCADRSSLVASQIFLAAEDEYSVRGGGPRLTHRQLGQVVLKETVRFYQISPSAFADKFRLSTEVESALEGVLDGYRVNTARDEHALFGALGFHLGAELLADLEFRLIHEYLFEEHAELVAHLRGRDIGYGLNAYHWIELHTTVESEHFDGAVRGAEVALRYYSGEQSRDQVAAAIVQGFRGFVSYQRGFFELALPA